MDRKRVLRRWQEYPGSCYHYDYEILCPHCGQWKDNYGDMDEFVEGEGFVNICNDCAETIRYIDFSQHIELKPNKYCNTDDCELGHCGGCGCHTVGNEFTGLGLCDLCDELTTPKFDNY